MKKGSPNFVTFLVLVATGGAAAACYIKWERVEWTMGVILLGIYLSASPRVVNEWERGVLLLLGRFNRVLPPGISWVIPGLHTVASLVDMRVRSTSFSAERALTHDTVPVNVDAVLFWVVTDARRAILEVERFQQTVSWAAQTTLRDMIGKTDLVRMISDRQALDDELQTIIDAKTSEWGITVQSVEVRDVRLPAGLEDAMSRKAQADREKEARIILAESERKVAEQMEQAAEIYARNSAALHLRAMNMTYESVKERSALDDHSFHHARVTQSRRARCRRGWISTHARARRTGGLIMQFWPISSESLHRRGVDLPADATGRSTLLPFFDSRGVIHRVMVVPQDGDDIYFFSPREVRLRWPWWGRMDLVTLAPTLTLLEFEDLEFLTTLWHYDPWWLLASASPRAQRLKPTNVVDRFAERVGNVQRLQYSRDLRRVLFLVYKKGQSAGWCRFCSALLPVRQNEDETPLEPMSTSQRRKTVWILDPFWRAATGR